MRITLKGGQVKEFAEALSGLQLAGELSQGLKKSALAMWVDGEFTSLTTMIDKDCEVEFVTFEEEEGRRTYRHSASHILAQAVKRLMPDVKLAIGPAIENGFYYDFDSAEPFTPETLQKISKEMDKIVKQNLPIERFELPRNEAIALCKELNEPYKVELIEDLPEGSVISFYKQGEFTDLCAGPHLPSTGRIKAFALQQVAGAYWRGDEKNKMLQRVYGTAFDTKEALKAYLDMLEEAKKRDHRKLGRELDLFSLQEEGPGFPFFHPKGMVLRNILEDYWRKIHTANGYQEVKTPIMLNRELWLRSGHWDHYKDNMYTTEIDEQMFAIKPMNCPGGMLMYKRRNWSYRDLPIRMGELGLVHRHELSGALHGLMRVRCFTQDDAHIFMTPDQIRDEIIGVIDLTEEVYKTFGFDFHVELSTRPDDYMGELKDWDMATSALEEALKAKGMNYVINEGDGAFYGPKIDFHLKDCIGRTWQCGTIQLDFQMPERFDLTYVGADGEKHRPVMIHRVVFGSIERFIGILTEQFAGAFPLWITPVQVKVMTVTDRVSDYALKVAKELTDAGFRVEADIRNEKIGFKIREAQMEKIPYMLIIGDKEVEEGTISVRSRRQADMGSMQVPQLIETLNEEVDSKAF